VKVGSLAQGESNSESKDSRATDAAGAAAVAAAVTNEPGSGSPAGIWSVSGA